MASQLRPSQLAERVGGGCRVWASAVVHLQVLALSTRFWTVAEALPSSAAARGSFVIATSACVGVALQHASTQMGLRSWHAAALVLTTAVGPLLFLLPADGAGGGSLFSGGSAAAGAATVIVLAVAAAWQAVTAAKGAERFGVQQQGLRARVRAQENQLEAQQQQGIELTKDILTVVGSVDRALRKLESNGPCTVDDILQTMRGHAHQLLHAERLVLFMVNPVAKQLVLHDQLHHERVAFDIADETLVAAGVARSGKAINLHDAYADVRFGATDRKLDAAARVRTTSLLAMGIKDPHGVVVAVLQCANHRTGLFTLAESKKLAALCSFMSQLITQKLSLGGQLYFAEKEDQDAVNEMLGQSMEPKLTATEALWRTVHAHKALAANNNNRLDLDETVSSPVLPMRDAADTPAVVRQCATPEC